MPAEPTPVHRYIVHDVVRVNPDVRDPDIDIEIAGWQGSVIEISADEDGQMVTIAWDAATRQRMESWIIDYCEEEGIDCDVMTLSASEVSLVTPGDTAPNESPLGPHLKALTREAVQQLADSPAVFQRGVQYLHSDAIHQFSVTSWQIKAKVNGNYGDYTVEVTDTPDELEMICTCPYEGWVCKHLVAVLLRFVEMDKAAVVDVSLPEIARQTLASMSQQELLQLIFDLANERDEFRRALMARLTIAPQLIAQQPRSSAQVRALKQQIAQFFDELAHRAEYGYDGYYDEEYDPGATYPELATTFEIARTLHPLDQQEVFWYALTCANEIEEEMPMGTPQIAEALVAYVDATRAVVHTSEERHAIWTALLDVLDWAVGDAEGIEEAVHQAIGQLCETPEDTRQLITLLQATDEAGFADWIAAYYRQLGDDDAYLATRQAHLVTESQHLELANYWEQHGNADEAREVLEQYVLRLIAQMDQQTQPYYGVTYVQPGGVLDRLETAYRDAGDEKNLCRILFVQSRARALTVERYQQIKALSQSLGTWAEMQPVLLDAARYNRETLAQIYLLEEDWDTALQLAQEKSPYGFGYADSVRPLVARGVKAHRPEEALGILRPLVQSYIDQQNRSAYATAAGFAADIKDIYRNILHDDATWQAYITGIRQHYPRHRALQEEFRGL
ncbi:MAG: SWIM zinc finger family protein [Armatimonadota bacterium]